MPEQKQIKNQILIYKPRGGDVEVEVKLERETIWLDAHQMAKLFGVNRPAVVKHINNIYKTGELNKNSTCSILEQVAIDEKIRKMDLFRKDGKRKFNDNALTTLCLLIAISDHNDRNYQKLNFWVINYDLSAI